MDTFIQDIRVATRTILKQRATTAIAVICLALGIGANTAIFSVVRAVLFESLPFREPSHLVRVYETSNVQGTREIGSVAVLNYLDWRAQQTIFESMAAYSSGGNGVDLSGGGPPERVTGQRATASLFHVLGVRAAIGRAFALDDDQPGHNPVAVLSDGLWRRRFGADPSIVGRTISLDNTPYSVIGVMPRHFDYPISSVHTDVWVPLVWNDNQKNRGNRATSVVARLKPGVDSAAAATQMASIAARIARDFPGEMKERGIQVSSLNAAILGGIRSPLLMLLGAVGLVLLIACANVANLLLARASGRRREVAIRTALGAERSRLVRQFLTESVILALSGGALGLAVAQFGLEAILVYAATSLPRANAIGLNGGVLAFVAVISLATGIGFGIIPALRASQTDLREDLAASAGRTGTGRQHHRTLSALVVAEISLSIVLLIGAGLLVRGFVAVISIDAGFKADRVLTFHLGAPGTRMPDRARYINFYGPVLERLRGLPGVRDAATTTLLPIQQADWNGHFTIVGRPEEMDLARKPFAEYRVVSSNYFRALGIAMAEGREFTDHDAASAPPVVIVNDEFVRRYFPNEDPIGKQILPWTDEPATIVGVAHSVRQVSLDQAPRSELYVPAAQTPWQLFDVTYVLRAETPPTAMMSAVRAVVHEIAPDQPIFRVQTMHDVIAESLTRRKLTLSLLAVFAALALLLSAAGVYGVMSYSVAQRRREIGIRMALGASSTKVTSMIITDAGKLALLGVAIGLVAAVGVTRVLAGMLYGVGTRDPATFAVVAGLIMTVAFLASVVPAMRASRVDPLAAMRVD